MLSHPPMNADPQALNVAQKLHEEKKPLATVLYGSRAAGTHHADSDIDILMITEDPEQLDPNLEHRAKQLALEEYGKPVEVQIKLTEDEDALENEALADSITGQALMKGIIISDWPRIYQSRYRGDEPAPAKLCWHQYKAHNELAKNFLESIERVPNTLSTTTHSNSGPGPQTTPDGLAQTTWRNGTQGVHHALRAAVEAHTERTRATESHAQLAHRLASLAPAEDASTTITMDEYDSDTIPSTMTPAELAEAIAQDIKHLRRLAMKLMRRVKTAQNKNADPLREQHETMARMVRSGIRNMARIITPTPDSDDPPRSSTIATVNEHGKITLTVTFDQNPMATHHKARQAKAMANPESRTIELTITPNWTATAGYTDAVTGETVTIDLDEQEQTAVDAFASREADYFITDDIDLWPENQDDDDDPEHDPVEAMAQLSQEELEEMIESSQQEIDLIRQALARKHH